MRSIARIGFIAAVAGLAGCQSLVTYDGDRFSPTVYDEVPPHPVRFPVKLTYPDYTMFGFPMYDEDPRADLKLESIACRRGDDGRLVVLADVRNMGADDIYRVPFFSGDMAAFRVAATVTTASGAQERFEAVRYLNLYVARDVVLKLNSTVIPAADVRRIEVVADPDRIVPDPIRDNNVLAWQGAIDPANPQCDVRR
ncbi:MAG TPA: hypothetical protein VJQ49_07240 [Casimicrobiaceae bacterium]|nr:hypothetical protein [Casimicrobiaceae bacterium]